MKTIILVLKRLIEDANTSNKDRSILLTFLGLYQREIDPPMAVKNLFKRFFSTIETPTFEINIHLF